MALRVVGAGFGRTGTLSMKAALEQLGLGPCHHMVEVYHAPGSARGWNAAIRGEAVDLDALVEGYVSAVDFPVCAVWQPMADHFPEASVLLTVRSSASWWASFDATIGPRIADPDTATEDPDGRRMMAAIRDVVFSGDPLDRAVAVGAYEAHNAEVIATVAPERLCVYEVGSGWEPLCDFFGLPVPDQPFPSSNSTEEFLARRAAEQDQ